MTEPLRISNVHFAPSSEAFTRTGRLGTLSFECGAFHVSDVQLRRSATGRIYLSYRYAQTRPASDGARFQLEVATISALGIKAEVPPQ